AGTWSFFNPSITQTAVTFTPGAHRSYIDVQFVPTSGNTLDDASITDTTGTHADELSLSGAGLGAGAGPARLDGGQAPMSLGGGKYRYFLTGTFVPGVVTVTFIGGSFTSNSLTNLPENETFTAVGPTADLVNPNDGGVVGAGTLNDRGYIDVSLPTEGKT